MSPDHCASLKTAAADLTFGVESLAAKYKDANIGFDVEFADLQINRSVLAKNAGVNANQSFTDLQEFARDTGIQTLSTLLT